MTAELSNNSMIV